MQKIKLLDNLMIRSESKESCICLNITTGQIFLFEGDISDMILILKDKNAGLSINSLSTELGKKNSHFSKIKHKEKVLSDAVEYLDSNGLLEKQKQD